MKRIVVNTGPFIHLSQINELTLLKRFPRLNTPSSVISEISLGDEMLAKEIRSWNNLKIAPIHGQGIPTIEEATRKFKLHPGERDVLTLAHQLSPCIVFTDDLPARKAAESLRIEVHGTLGIIAYAFRSKWISLKRAEESILLLQQKSSLFITSAIIERAIGELRKHS